MPLDIANHKEGVIMEIADNGRTAPQLCRPPVPLVIIAEGAIVHHGWDVGENPLGKQGRKSRERWGSTLRNTCANSIRNSAHKAEVLTADQTTTLSHHYQPPRTHTEMVTRGTWPRGDWPLYLPSGILLAPIWGGSGMAPLTLWSLTGILPKIAIWHL